jgi:ribosomal protein S27E
MGKGIIYVFKNEENGAHYYGTTASKIEKVKLPTYLNEKLGRQPAKTILFEFFSGEGKDVLREMGLFRNMFLNSDCINCQDYRVLKARPVKKINCECGSVYIKSNKRAHEKTRVHKNYLIANK